MKRAIPLALVAALAALQATSGHSQIDQDQGVRQTMRQKLEHAQNVLEGVAVEDFEMIARSAQALIQLSQTAEFQVFQTPEYMQYSAEFQRTAEELFRNAQEENSYAASLNYVQLTLNCVNCHNYVRGVALADADGGARPLVLGTAH